MSNPCMNEATCLDRIGGFRCICMLGEKNTNIFIYTKIVKSLKNIFNEWNLIMMRTAGVYSSDCLVIVYNYELV